MKRKIVLILIAIIVLSIPFQSTYHQVEGAVGSKAATLTAKKIVKEVIQEAAVNQAANLAVMEAMEIADKYEAKAGYKIVCLGGGTTCDKPVQVKETLTDADKLAIKSQSEVELDKLISPNGKGFSRWQSFLDWFLPIWVVTFAMSALTYAIDGDFRDLLNEAAYNALVALGIIVPVNTTIPIEESEPIKDETDGKYKNNDGVPVLIFKEFSMDMLGSKQSNATLNVDSMAMPFKDVYTVSTFNYGSLDFTNLNFDLKYYQSTATFAGFTGSQITVGNSLIGLNPTTIVNVNGVTVYNGKPSSSPYNISTPEITSILQKKIVSMRTRLPYSINGFNYTDVMFESAEGDIIHAQTKTSIPTEGKFYRITMGSAYSDMSQSTVTTKVYTGVTPYKQILVPTYDESGVNPIANSGYISEDGKRIALAPPTAIPYKQESTGETVYRTPTPTGDAAQFEKPDGTIVPEEDVVPDDPPEVIKDPEGVPSVTPTPTPSNPAPEPIPLTPAPTPTGETPPPTTPPTTGEDAPLEPFPEGESCQEKLKFPIFSPLKEQLSTSFPFSIPWDIERAAQAAFGGISDEKPSFKMPIVMFGETHEVIITTPKFMDDWKPFTDSLLLITFDILIMFGLYRFVKGAGS